MGKGGGRQEKVRKGKGGRRWGGKGKEGEEQLNTNKMEAERSGNESRHRWKTVFLASFPGHSRLQLLIACSNQCSMGMGLLFLSKHNTEDTKNNIAINNNIGAN